MEPDETSNPSRTREIAVRVIDAANPTERELLADWARQLVEIKNSNLSKFEKGKRAVLLSTSSKTLLPLMKVLAVELKRVGWDERGWSARLGLAGIITGVLVFSGQGAGIAALGGAIGVPLWVVLGAGGAFAGQLIEAANRRKQAPQATSQARTKVVDGEVVERDRDGA